MEGIEGVLRYQGYRCRCGPCTAWHRFVAQTCSRAERWRALGSNPKESSSCLLPLCLSCTSQPRSTARQSMGSLFSYDALLMHDVRVHELKTMFAPRHSHEAIDSVLGSP